MFDMLLTPLFQLWEWIKTNLGFIVEPVFRFLSKAWFITVAFFGFVFWAFQTVESAIVQVINTVSSMVVPSAGTPGVTGAGGITYLLQLANTFVPLQETLAFLVTYFAFHVILSLYRIIKSWIPTLS